MITVVYGEDMSCCVRWEILLHEPFSGVLICKGFGRAITAADPTEVGRTVLAAYLAGRSTRDETFRVVVRTDNGYQSVITAGQLADTCWVADPAICQVLPTYLRNALA
ncbi:hypothetical protein [Streptomyces sp. NPDC051452]|uniref:hypothetical protein n=1 Tax=Streptomyces sp. NPDC051452 TaxID=3365654 RepID=UPI0037B1758D